MHHHAGFVLAYVLEGNVVTKVSGQSERVYETGEMFYEPPGSTHEVSNNASSTEPAKLLAFIFAKKSRDPDDARTRQRPTLTTRALAQRAPGCAL
jgi:quercetin dioxygenase-like cupin family protein